jgi:hypothetical protein
MSDTGSATKRTLIEKFFMNFFYADYLDDPSDIEAALAEYLKSTRTEDAGGKILLSQTEELLARNLDDDQLERLMVQWGSNVYPSLLGISCRSILVQIRDFLRGQG